MKINKDQNNMTTPPLKKSISRPPWRLGLLLIPVVVACFALAQSARAVTPQPEVGNPNDNIAEEETAEMDVSSSEANIATGQETNDEPNRRAFRFNFRGMRQCASGDVTMGGELVVTFQNVFRSPTNFRMKPKFVAVKAFNGTVQSGNRPLRVNSVEIKDVEASLDGTGTFKIEMIVTGPALPGGRPLRFDVLFSPNNYTFNTVQVTQFTPDRTPHVTCDL